MWVGGGTGGLRIVRWMVPARKAPLILWVVRGTSPQCNCSQRPLRNGAPSKAVRANSARGEGVGDEAARHHPDRTANGHLFSA